MPDVKLKQTLQQVEEPSAAQWAVERDVQFGIDDSQGINIGSHGKEMPKRNSKKTHATRKNNNKHEKDNTQRLT